MDHVRSLVAFTHDRKAADYIQFVQYLTIYTELRYKLEILHYYRFNSYPPNSLLATAPLSFNELMLRNNEIPIESKEYERNTAQLESIRAQKEAEIQTLTNDFNESIETILESDYIKRYKYSLAYLDMLRRQLKNHSPWKLYLKLFS